MASNENLTTTTGGGMSVREAGKRGGDRVKSKYGSEFYEAIGRKGGEATKSKYGPNATASAVSAGDRRRSVWKMPSAASTSTMAATAGRAHGETNA